MVQPITMCIETVCRTRVVVEMYKKYVSLTLCHPYKNMCLKVARMCLTFQMMTLEEFEIFWRGYPHFGPLKCGVSKNDHPSTTYDPTFLLQNPFPHKKCGCLQKTRAQSVKI